MSVYVDGSCLGNGKEENTGGFSVVELDNNNKVVFAHSEQSKNTTNNREEMKAILYALKKYGQIGNFFTIVVYSDSNYCVQTFNEWMYSWQRNGWLKSDRKPPENLDLVKEYYDLITNKGYCIDLRKIKGHVGKYGNELADKLATGKISPKEVINNND